jgi:hypothetical protein
MMQVNFQLNVPVEEFSGAAAHVSEAIAGIDGLQWKVWILNADENEAGGFYCFESRDARDTFLAGPLATQLYNAPIMRDVVIKRFDVMETHMAITRGPVGAADKVAAIP